MLRYSNWRLALLLTIIFTATLLGLALFAQSSGCAADQSCIRSGMWIIAALGLMLSVGVTLFITAQRSQALSELKDMAQRVAAGDFDARILPHSSGEEADLTRAVNEMADRLRSEVRQLASENLQLSIVFQNMADGAIITDALGRVLLTNPAASRMLNYDMQQAFGRSYAEIVRHHQLIDLWQVCRNEGREAVAAVEIDRNLFLQAFRLLRKAVHEDSL